MRTDNITQPMAFNQKGSVAGLVFRALHGAESFLGSCDRGRATIATPWVALIQTGSSLSGLMIAFRSHRLPRPSHRGGSKPGAKRPHLHNPPATSVSPHIPA